jgi:hypothetical protein
MSEVLKMCLSINLQPVDMLGRLAASAKTVPGH